MPRMKKPYRELKWITGPPVADTSASSFSRGKDVNKSVKGTGPLRIYLLGVTVRRQMIILRAVNQLNTVCPRLKPLFSSRERKDKVVAWPAVLVSYVLRT